MEISPDIIPNQEYKSEIRLSPKVVQDMYNKVKTKDGEFGERKYVHDLINDVAVAFDEKRLEENRDTIVKLADQLQPRFSNKKTLGFDSRSAVNDKYQDCWDIKGENYKQLLTLISAIGLGRVTTSKEYLKHCPIKEKSIIKYLIDKETYLKYNPKKN